MLIELINPKRSTHPPARRMAPRPISLDGVTVGLLSNQKSNADNLLLETARWFMDKHQCKTLAVESKEDMSRPADPSMLQSISKRADFLLTAAGD